MVGWSWEGRQSHGIGANWRREDPTKNPWTWTSARWNLGQETRFLGPCGHCVRVDEVGWRWWSHRFGWEGQSYHRTLHRLGHGEWKHWTLARWITTRIATSCPHVPRFGCLDGTNGEPFESLQSHSSAHWKIVGTNGSFGWSERRHRSTGSKCWVDCWRWFGTHETHLEWRSLAIEGQVGFTSTSLWRFGNQGWRFP